MSTGFFAIQIGKSLKPSSSLPGCWRSLSKFSTIGVVNLRAKCPCRIFCFKASDVASKGELSWPGVAHVTSSLFSGAWLALTAKPQRALHFFTPHFLHSPPLPEQALLSGNGWERIDGTTTGKTVDRLMLSRSEVYMVGE